MFLFNKILCRFVLLRETTVRNDRFEAILATAKLETNSICGEYGWDVSGTLTTASDLKKKHGGTGQGKHRMKLPPHAQCLPQPSSPVNYGTFFSIFFFIK